MRHASIEITFALIELQQVIAESNLSASQKSEAESATKEINVEVNKPEKERAPGRIKAALDRLTGIVKSAGNLSKTADAAIVLERCRFL